MIDLRSDTVTKPSKEMLEAMFKAEVGDDVFEDDPTINLLQEKAADLLGKKESLFVPSGTMGNQICVRINTKLGDEVILEYGSHIFNYEAGSPATLSGVQIHPLKAEKGFLAVEQINSAIRPDNEHFASTKLICLENTHNRAGGTVYPLKRIGEISTFARKNNFKLHLDGARLFNAVVASKTDVKEIVKHFDTVSVCLSKGLGTPVGSIIAGNDDFFYKARRVRKSFGGGMRQAGFLAAAGIFALENNIERLEEDHENARLLAEEINGVGGIEIDLENLQTNIVILDISKTKFNSNEEALESLEKEGILMVAFGVGKLRAVTHLDVSKKQIQIACEVIKNTFS